MPVSPVPWPAIPFGDWQDTAQTVHLWTQIVGKTRMVHAPALNHSWHVTLYVSARGLTTGPIHHPTTTFEIEFDFIRHQLRVTTVNGDERNFALRPMTVAEFYDTLMQTLRDLGVPTRIWSQPVELPDPVLRFPEDTIHSAYDARAMHDYWLVLVRVHRVFTMFRARFVGKVSPVQFFWGAFDLAVTRFSGRSAPLHPGGAPNCADWVMQEAYSHEVCSAGFWPGTGLGEAAFYSYAYPEPPGYREARVQPLEGAYHQAIGEFLLPYEAVRSAADPEATLLAFLQSTYEVAADLGHWARADLEWREQRASAQNS